MNTMLELWEHTFMNMNTHPPIPDDVRRLVLRPGEGLPVGSPPLRNCPGCRADPVYHGAMTFEEFLSWHTDASTALATVMMLLS